MFTFNNFLFSNIRLYVALFINYRVIPNDCRGFNNLSYTVHLRLEYIVAPMDQEILGIFFYDVLCAVVMHFSRN